jgi:hypothetical protein
MRQVLTILTLIILANPTVGQEIYIADRESYRNNKFVYEFYLFTDSTCYLKGHYLDNSIYFIYKGYIKQKTDSIYDFYYQPIIELSCNKRLMIKDSIRFTINQIDTVLPSMIFNIKVKNEGWQDIYLSSLKTIIHKKEIDKFDFTIDCKYSDPLTGEKIIMKVPKTSEPELSYFGHDTDFIKSKISMKEGEIILYPDNFYIHNRDKMILKN